MADTGKPVQLDRRGRVAVLTIDNPPVNALSQHVRAGLREGLREAPPTRPRAPSSSSAPAGRSSPAPTSASSASRPREPGLPRC